MDHVAIMKKSWGLIPKILSGKKVIESRWLKNKSAPWNKVGAGDTVYFKNSGEPVMVAAIVSKVLQLDKLNPQKVEDLLTKYHSQDGIEKEKIKYYFELFKPKKFCVLVFLTHPQKISPFNIDKSGFGSMSAWLTINSVKKIKVPAF